MSFPIKRYFAQKFFGRATVAFSWQKKEQSYRLSHREEREVVWGGGGGGGCATIGVYQ